MTCKVGDEKRAGHARSASRFDDDSLKWIADQQTTREDRTGPNAGASQRYYNMAVRREIRKRGIHWQPPGLGT